ncbi:hypothetical protein JCM11251_003801 [Rhodosporidiobolus azoricus]
MPSRPPLTSALSTGLLSFLAPSYRTTAVIHSTTRQARSASTVNRSARSVAGAGRKGNGAGGRGPAGADRELSGLARVKERDERSYEAGWSFPVASTSAIRLDAASPFSPHSPNLTPPMSAKAAGKRRANDVDAIEADATSSADLPAVLHDLRSLHTSSPDISPLVLVQQIRLPPAPLSGDEGRGPRRPPPAPPPLIRLDPQPHSSSTSFLTPFLLQALFLGASALGLLARRKVRRPEESAVEVRESENDRAKREAEERVDGLQALNLLVGALAVPEAELGVEAAEEKMWEWRKEKLQPLLGIVRNLGGAEAKHDPVDRLAIASVLHYVSVRPPKWLEVRKYEQARPVLAEWAMHAFERLKAAAALSSSVPAPLSSANLPLPPKSTDISHTSIVLSHANKLPTAHASPLLISDDLILLSLLSIVYQSGTGLSTPSSRRIDQTCGQLSSADRRILNSVARRVLTDENASTLIIDALAHAAVRAARPDILHDLLSRPSLPPSLCLSAAAQSLDLYSRMHTDGRSAGRILFAVDQLVEAMGQLASFAPNELDRLHFALLRLRSGTLSGGLALERTMQRLALLALKIDAPAVVSHPRLLPSLLTHLARSRNLKCAYALLRAITPELRSVQGHYEPLLRSFHLATATKIWTALRCDPALEQQRSPETFHAYLLSHALDRQTPSSTVLASFQTLYAHMRYLRIPFTLEMHRTALRILVRHGTDAVVRRHLRRMKEEDGFDPQEDAKTLAILATREMSRLDMQQRVVSASSSDSLDRRRRMEDRPRRGGGRAQMRKVVEAVGELQLVASRNGVEGKTSMASNILLKSLTRWTREVDVVRLVNITKDQVGIDLSTFLHPPAPVSSPSPPAQKHTSSLSSSDHLEDPKHWYNHRRPALLLLKKAFENRGRRDLGAQVEKVVRKEKGEVERGQRRRKRLERECEEKRIGV